MKGFEYIENNGRILNPVNIEEQKEGVVYNTYADLYDAPITKYSVSKEGTTSIVIPSDTVVYNLKNLMFGDHRGDGLFNELFNLSYYIDKIPHGIVDKQIAGVGATTLEINSERDSIIVFPTKVLAYNKSKKHPQSLYVGSDIEGLPTTTEQVIREYLEDDKIEYKKLLVVADSMTKVYNAITKEGLNNFFYMVDEIDLLQADSNYRPTLESVIDYYFLFSPRNRALISATLNDFSNPILKNECRFDISWGQKTKRNIELIHCDNINQIVVEEINKHKEEKIFIAYNSILNILNVISQLEEDQRAECAILCSEASIEETGDYYQKLTDDNKLPKRINFATCCYFTGVDIDDSYHLITISNIKRSYQVLSLDRIEQIYGRCRIERGVKSDTIIYNTKEKKWGDIITKGYRELLIRKANKVISLLRSADDIIEDSPDLLGFFEVMKSHIVDNTMEQLPREEPINLIRTNIDGKVVPAYLNIDYLVEKQRTLSNYIVGGDNFATLLSKEHNVNYVEFSSPITEEQENIESQNSSEQSAIFDGYILEAIEEIKEMSSLGQLTDIEIDRKINRSKRNKKLFYQRFKRLYRYADIDTLLEVLYTIRAKDNKAFKNVNNAVIYWALADNHPFKVSVRSAFEIEKQYSATEIREALTPIIYYHLFKNLSPRRYINFFSSFYALKRPRSKYVIVSENPLNIASQNEIIPMNENNLVKYFIL